MNDSQSFSSPREIVSSQRNRLQNNGGNQVAEKIGNIKKMEHQNYKYFEIERQFFQSVREQTKEDDIQSSETQHPHSNKVPSFLNSDLDFQDTANNEQDYDVRTSSICSKQKIKSEGGGTTKENQNIMKSSRDIIKSSSQNLRLKSVIEFSYCQNKKNLTAFPKSGHLNEEFLQIIELKQNRIKAIPEEIFRLKNLKVLRMDSNFIRELPEQLFQYLQLEIFSISNNLLTKLPDSLSSQQKMIYLDISMNRIDDIDNNTINNLKSLKCLIINNNEFRCIPLSFANLNNLKEIHLDWFKYTSPPLPSQCNDKSRIQKFINLLKQYQHVSNDQGIEKQLIEKYKQNQESDSEQYECLSFKKQGVSFIKFVEYFSLTKFYINQCFSNNRTYVHQAAIEEDIGALIGLLEYNYESINALDDDNNTALSLAIMTEKFFSCKSLIQMGADVNLGGGFYGSCLNITVIKQQLYVLQDILKQGGDTSKTDDDGNSSLHYLVTVFNRDCKLNEKIFYLLLKHGANPNLTNKEGWTPVHLAVKKGQLEMLELMIKYNQNINENQQKQFQQNKKGGQEKMSALHLAVINGSQDILELLLDNGCDINAINIYNKTPQEMSLKDSFIAKILKKKEIEWLNKYFFHSKMSNQPLNQIENDKNGQQKWIKTNKNGFSGPAYSFGKQQYDNQQMDYLLKLNSYQSPKNFNKKIDFFANSDYSGFDIDVDLEEEEFSFNELDENKVMQEVMATNVGIINRQLTYAPNNIKIIEKFFKNSQKMGKKNYEQLQQKDDIGMTQKYFVYVKQLVEKTANMIDYYQTSLEKFIQGIESSFTCLSEKFRFLSIMMKLYIEFEQMVNTVNFEKKKILDFNLNLMDEELLKSEQYFCQINQSVMNAWIRLINNIETKQTIISNVQVQEFNFIKEFVFHIFGTQYVDNSLDILHKQIKQNKNNLPIWIQYEIYQSIKKIKSSIYQNILQNKGKFNQQQIILNQKIIQNNQNYFPLVNEPSAPNLTFRSNLDDDELSSNLSRSSLSMSMPKSNTFNSYFKKENFLASKQNQIIEQAEEDNLDYDHIQGTEENVGEDTHKLKQNIYFSNKKQFHQV